LDKLRPYQQEAIDKIFTEWRNGKRSVLFQMPTGTGKTVIFSEIVRRGHAQQKHILIVAHRIELIDQIVNKLKHYGVEAGIIKSGIKPDDSKIVQVASIQTLMRRDKPEANLIIIDECHHAKADSYKKLWEIYPNSKLLGVTATPVRLSGEGFDDLFDVLIPSMHINEFIQQGYLSKVTHKVCSFPKLQGVKKRGGDYETEMLKHVMMDDVIMADLVESYQKYTNGKSTIVFAVDIEHSQDIVRKYTKAGIKAAHIDANTPKEVREKVISDFKQKKITVISNVEIITEGFDFPECEVVQLARPTKSLSLYLQMVGRVGRIAVGKEQGIILDNASLWLEHGFATIDRDWSLKGLGKKPRKIIPEKEFAFIDDDGIIHRYHRFKPTEIKGMNLVDLTEAVERLFDFEKILQHAKMNEYKLISSYYHYLDYLNERDISLCRDEFIYIVNRLNKINANYPEEKKFKPGFWKFEEEKFQFK
jgi:superfamily II DNA or RNA helicase